MRRLEPLWVLLGYAAASVLLIGRHLLAAPRDAVVGSFGADQGFFSWSFVHWIEVLAGAQTPFLTDRIDAPLGFNLAWATTIPGPALLMAPVTALAGPLTSYNVLALAAPALAAWTAYLLCRHLTADPVAAILGGWCFGFSSYLLGQTLNHLNLALVFALPAIALLVVRLVEGSIRRVPAIIGLAALIAFQFLVFMEIAATAALVGGLTLVAALAIGPADRRRRIVAALPSIAIACALALVAVSPLLLAALLHPNPIDERIRPDLYPLDVQNLLVPTTITWIGGEHFAERSLEFAGNLTEQLAYLGPLLIAVAVAGAIRWRRWRGTWVVVAGIAVALVLAAGARLTSGGDPHGPALPWAWIEQLPLIRLALPTRIVVYAWIGIAVLVALFAARRPGEATALRATRAVIAALALALLLPTPRADVWRTSLAPPAGIASGAATAAVPDDAVVLVLPYSFRGDGMYWQALERMRWRQAGSYSAAALPAQYARFPIMGALYGGALPPDAERELLRFLAYTGTSWVLIDDRRPGPWPLLLERAGGVRSDVGGVIRFRLDPREVRARLAGA